jgi:glycosyltransferase involved in cell wall biosynthesis
MSPAAPRVSVLMPVHRPDPAYFPLAVRSILEQSLAELELVIVEAPSEREAGELLPLDDPRVRRVRAHRPSLVDQLNQGLALCRAPLVARMDADDLSDPERLRRQVERLEAEPELDVLGAQLRVIDAEGRACGLRRYPLGHEAIVAALPYANPLAHPAVAFRRQVVVDAGGYRPFGAAEDYELWCRLAARGRRFANCAEPLLAYRLHAGSVKTTRVRDALESGLRIKQLHWGARLPMGARLRCWAEQLALHLPPAWVGVAYERWQYRRPRAAVDA